MKSDHRVPYKEEEEEQDKRDERIHANEVKGWLSEYEKMDGWMMKEDERSHAYKHIISFEVDLHLMTQRLSRLAQLTGSFFHFPPPSRLVKRCIP